MKIQFSGEIFNFPPPVPGEGEVVISPERYFPIEVKRAAKPDRILSLFNIGKVLFFIYREGISLTLSKVLAVLAHRKQGRGRALVVAIGRESETGRPAIALGGQDCPYAEKLCFARSLVSLAGDDARDLEADATALIAYCAAHPDMAAGLRNWSRFSGEEPAVTLVDAVRQGRPFIESGTPSLDAKAVTVRFPDAGDAESADAGSTAPESARGRTGLFLAGAGTYPCAYALPIFRRAGIPFDTVIDLNPVRAAQVAKRFNFIHADSNSERGLLRLSAYDEPILVIATYHSTHADIVEQALTINPATKIMLEKPPVTTLEQLERVNRFRRQGAYIEIGFNRRHIPMTKEAREQVLREDGPIVMTCIVKELVIPASHWYHWPDQGTRITGNVCHWLDLGRYFIAAEPERMFVIGAPEKEGEEDGVTIVVCYADGSRLHVVATDRGSSLRGVQEFIEIRRGDLTVTIEDFLRMRAQAGARQITRRRIIRDKGHRRMYAHFMENIRTGAPTEFPTEDLTVSTLQYLRASEALQSGAPVTEIDLREPWPPQRAESKAAS